MKTEEFTRKDGTKGTKNILENGDKFTSRFDSPRVTKTGMYDNYSLGITTEKGENTFVQLTKGQADKLKKLGNVQAEKLECYEYESHNKKCVGIRKQKV